MSPNGSRRVVATRVRNRTASLDENVGQREVELVTLADWEGRDIFSRSAGLVVLEAMHRAGLSNARLGASWATGREIVLKEPAIDARIVAQINGHLAHMIRERAAIREETWPIDDALDLLRAEHQDDAGTLLELSSRPTVTLVSCGSLHFPSRGVVVPNAGLLEGISVVPHPVGLAIGATPPRRASRVGRRFERVSACASRRSCRAPIASSTRRSCTRFAC